MKKTRKARMVNETSNERLDIQYYSTEQLTLDILGIDKNNFIFEGEKRNIREMINCTRSFLNATNAEMAINSRNQIQIPKDEYSTYLSLYSKLYNSEINGKSVKSLMSKSVNGESIGDKEMHEIALIFQELVDTKLKGKLEYDLVTRWMDDKIKKDFVEAANYSHDEINKIVSKTIQEISLIYAANKKMLALEKYTEAIKKISEMFIEQIEDELIESNEARLIDDMIIEKIIGRNAMESNRKTRDLRKVEEAHRKMLGMVEEDDEESKENISRFFNECINIE